MRIPIPVLALAPILLCAPAIGAQDEAGPMRPSISATRPAAPASQPAQAASASAPAPSGTASAKPAPAPILVPAGTHLTLVLHNTITTRTAKPGDPVYLETTYPVTIDNRVVIPRGSYLQGEILEAKRPGKVGGKAELTMRLNTMLLPNGYSIDFNASPTNAGSDGKESTDSEGKIHGRSGKAGDAGTVATTTGVGATIGSVATHTMGGARTGALIGAAVGLGAILMTRGPELELPRGTPLEAVLERAVYLDASRIDFTDTTRTPSASSASETAPKANE
jgi:hypothetical protein